MPDHAPWAKPHFEEIKLSSEVGSDVEEEDHVPACTARLLASNAEPASTRPAGLAPQSVSERLAAGVRLLP